MKRWTTPIRILLLYLAALAIGGSWSWGGWSVGFWLTQILHWALLVGSGLLVHKILVATKLGRPTRWEHQAITALILFVLFDPTTPWIGFVFIGAITELVQRLVRLPSGPLLNPAAAGAVLATLLKLYPAWWGVSFAPRLSLFEGGMSVAMLLTLPVAGYVAYKYKRLAISLAALVIFIPAYMMILQMSPVFVLLEGTLAFFLLVMVVEPKTSPALRTHQLAYGGLLGLGTVLSIKWGWLEPYSMALLVINLVFNLYKNQPSLLRKFKSPAVASSVSKNDASDQADEDQDRQG